MNLHETIQNNEKSVATKNLLRDSGTATVINIKKDGILDKHQSKTNALLVLLEGHAIYEEEDREVELSTTHDFVNIPKRVTHRVKGIKDTLLLLVQ